MSNNNPKLFYNQNDYNGSGRSNNSHNNVIHKPDEISSATDLQPPPPYSPDLARKSSDSNNFYGSTVRNLGDEQQIGLSSQESPESTKKQQQPRWANNNQPSSTNTHLEQQPASMPSWEHRRRRANGDPGCRRKWCKYLFIALLLWLVLIKYSDKIGLTPPPSNAPHGTVCPANAVSWQELPRIIDFEKNVEVVLEGHVSGGHVVVTPLEDRHGGTIISDIQFMPSSLNEKMTCDVQHQDDTTRLTLKMPSHLYNSEECVSLNIEIRLPYSADSVRVAVSNVDVQVHPFFKDVETVEIHTANGNLELDRWSGESIKLITSNSDIKVGRLISGGSIYIENSNGPITLSENIQAKKQVDIVTSNGAIGAFESIVADDTVRIRSSNAWIRLGGVSADNVFVESSNNGISVDSVKAKVQVIAKSSNGPINLSVAGEKNSKVAVSTTGSPIELHMITQFEGQFMLSTSNGDVIIKDDEYIEYRNNSRHLKIGERRGSGNKGDLTVTNDNADITVSFDI